jgi:hypothetical protein
MRDSGYDIVRGAKVLAALIPIIRALSSFRETLVEIGRDRIRGWLARAKGPIAESLSAWIADPGYCEYVGLTLGCR